MADQGNKIRGRFAPSPTGRMHLGNAFAAFMCWLGARHADGKVVLRIEDIDPDRSRREFFDIIEQDLNWLGLGWDEGPDKGGAFGPYTQGERLELYDKAIGKLTEQGAVYPCYCTRKELREAASAPHRRNAGPGYPGFCRDLSEAQRKAREATGRNPALRLIFPEAETTFDDLVLGPVSLDTRDLGGDFPIRRSDRVHAYQLAVVVDDILMGINQVVRGEDILDSTPRQLRLFELLGAKAPDFAHVPLLVDTTGKKLSKRHQDLELAALRERGVHPEAVIGYLAHKAGFIDRLRPAKAEEFVKGFEFKKLPKEAIMVEDNVERILMDVERK